MNDHSSSVRPLLAPLRDGPLPVPGPEEVRARRERLLPGLRSFVAAPPARQASRRWGLRLVPAAAAMAVAAAAVLWLRSGAEPPAPRLRVLAASGASFLEGGIHERLVVGAEVAHEVVETSAAGSAELDAAGVALELGASSRLRTRQLAAGALELDAGQLRCRVPPLGRERQFSVITPEARVVVHGTVFSVERVAAEARTCVRVEEGLVAVHTASGSTLLKAGESTGCEPSKRARVASTAPEPVVLPLPEPEPESERRASPRERSEPASALARQNRLLQRALAAEQSRDYPAAVQALEELRSRYPDSPLRDEANRALARVRQASRRP